ncbi:GPI anchored cell wall protein, putative [Trichophyton verrucosum HKI 0517]|uniref:GPI anchored cell wall protein, putative n=1 Tax=Trichophyton verrucosum (strain HKI 0517) TaxID=663202 RepID=D4DCA7_TRIVH|nr:GPI anchored cell wall protein, putative [Trichophyton verrucosum HKI 0517]EFE40527.1 GPI anchored cell wall protein, putative [Trichophyton verrucosum HKI 0517]
MISPLSPSSAPTSHIQATIASFSKPLPNISFKMQFKAIALTAIAAITPFTAAVGHAIVENHCDNNAYLWSVGGSVGPQQTITPGHTYSEQFRYDPVSGGIALKITRVKDGIYNGSPQTIFAYTLTDTNTFYDLSDVFGDAFAGTSGLLVSTSNPDCPDIWCLTVSHQLARSLLLPAKEMPISPSLSALSRQNKFLNLYVLNLAHLLFGYHRLTSIKNEHNDWIGKLILEPLLIGLSIQ